MVHQLACLAMASSCGFRRRVPMVMTRTINGQWPRSRMASVSGTASSRCSCLQSAYAMHAVAQDGLVWGRSRRYASCHAWHVKMFADSAVCKKAQSPVSTTVVKMA